MNADTNDSEGRAIPNEGDRLHQLLCAVVLGEASDDERAEVERALATSPELCAEKQRLEATIGLFQNALTDGESLAPTAERELEQALARRRRRPWYAHPGFRIAASFVAIGSAGWIAWRAFDVREVAFGDSATPATAALPESSSSKKLVATADRERQGMEVARLDRDEETVLRGLAYTGDANDVPAREGDSSDAKMGRIAAGERMEFDSGAAPTSEPTLASVGSGRDQAPSNPSLRDALDESDRESLSAEFVKRVEERRLESAEDTFVVQSVTSQEELPSLTSLGVPLLPAAGGAQTTKSGPTTPGPGGPATPGAVASDDGSRQRYKGPSDSVLPGAPKTEERKAGQAEDTLRARVELTGASKNDESKDSGGTDAADERFERGGQVALHGNEFVVVPDPQTIEARIDAIFGACRRRPNERPRDMYFRVWGDNGYEFPRFDRLSTFSVDVDTASYALARNYLVSGYLPEKAAVRTEEFLNYFKGDVRPPEKGTFAIETEVAPSLFGETSDALMLRVAIRGKEISKSERTPVALTFVIDVSGSMREGNRLELVKDSLRLLVTQLDARDSVAIVAFSNDATLVLPTTSAKNRLAIEQALQPLEPLQSTNTEAGLRLGYDQAFAHLDPNAQNRVVLLTDGVANVGVTDPNAMLERVVNQRKAGIYLNTIGVGMNNHNDGLLEQLADRGDGLCNYVDDAAEAKRALVDNFTGAFQPIARDVKVQVEFDPAQVERYRLLGYENRAIADQDFRNDAVDAGEVGAGHQVIALYELVPTHGAGDGPLATVRLRWKDPRGEGVSEQAHESAHAVTAKSVAGSYAATSPGYRRAVLVAQFAEFLRLSVHANGDSLDRLIEEARKLGGELHDPEFDEFVALVTKSRELIVARLATVDPCDRRLDDLRRIECRRAELEYLSRTGEVAELDARRAALEAELRECLRQRLSSGSQDRLRALGYLGDK